MNDTPYTEVREETESTTVNLLLHNGWMILKVYIRKSEVRFSSPKEWEEYPVYILGNMEGG